MNKNQLSKYFDHTLLKPTATAQEIETLCHEALEYGFYGVCVNSGYLPLAVKLLASSLVVPLTVVGFPLGAMSTASKVYESQWSIDQGAKEIDMVVNLGQYLSGQLDDVANDIAGVVKAAKTIPVKVIIETAYLDGLQIKELSKIAAGSGAAFIKTSTGFASRGASLEDITTIKETLKELNLPNSVKIKASGGIKNLMLVKQLIAAGANRIGASASVAIVKELT